MEDFIQDCAISDDGTVAAIAYSGIDGRILSVIDRAGALVARNHIRVTPTGWGDLRLVMDGRSVLLLDSGSGQSLRYDLP